MRILHRDTLPASRHVSAPTYDTVRLLIAEDDATIGLTDITLHPGIPAVYGYDHHLEVVYCLEGSAEIDKLDDAPVEQITPGSVWIARPGERFRFIAHAPTRLICVFTPPLQGDETGYAE